MSLAPRRRPTVLRVMPTLVAASVVAGLLWTSSAAAAAGPRMPAGYPIQVELPKVLLGAMVTGVEVAILPDGTERHRAFVYEVSRPVADGAAVQEHFHRLFEKLGWKGTFSHGEEGSFGRFTHRNVQVDLRIATDTSDPRAERVELAVRVFPTAKPDTRISKR